MTPEIPTVEGNQALGHLIDTLHGEGLIVEQPERNPVDDLRTAQITAAELAEAGATMDIRYTAKRASEMLGRLLRDLEIHRQRVGAPRA